MFSFPIIVVSWLTATVGMLAIYRGSTPEYYFLIAVPVLMFILTKLLNKSNALPVFVVVVLGIWGVVNTVITYAHYFTLGAQKAAIASLQQLNASSPEAQLVLDMEPIHAVGITYQLEQANLEQMLSSDSTTNKEHFRATTIIHLIYPYTGGTITTRLDNKVGLWVDSPATDL